MTLNHEHGAQEQSLQPFCGVDIQMSLLEPLKIFFKPFFIEVELIYNVLVSGVHQSDSVIHTYIHIYIYI